MLIRRRALTASLVLVLVIGMASTSSAKKFPGLSELDDAADGQVAIDAEHIEYDQRANVVTARGAVKITRGDMVLTADEVKVNRTTHVADAQGNVVLTDPEGRVSA